MVRRNSARESSQMSPKQSSSKITRFTSARSFSTGVGGSSLARDASKITLLDVFDAVESDASLFGFHAHPSPACPVGSRIHDVLDGPLSAAQDALRASLARTTIADLLAQL